MAVFGVSADNMDEISQFQMGRYISSNEAVWRIFSFPIHDRYPTVVHWPSIWRMDNVCTSRRQMRPREQLIRHLQP